MDINMPGLDGIAASEAITREVPFAQIVMMSVQSEADYLRRSMLAGARDFLTKPFTMDDLLSTIRRVHGMSVQARAAMPALQTVVPQAVVPASVKVGKLIGLYSPKGGVGCTALAVNVATAIARIDPSVRVAIADCCLQFGDVGILLDIRDSRSIVDLVEAETTIDAELLETAMVQEDRTGLSVLQASPKPEMAELVTVEHVRQILDQMSRMFDYVVVDIGSRLHDIELSILDLVDLAVLVITPDLPSIKDVRHLFGVFDALEYPGEKIRLVLNRSDPTTGLYAKTIENHLKHEICAEIPLEPHLVLQSVNQGIPYMILPSADKRASLIVQTGLLAQTLMQALEQEGGEDKPDERPLGRLFS
jgi:pilus assembly protein CpaE